jgi:general secretion pathway protein A
MFTDHFHMTDQPFSEPAPTDHLLRDDRISQALARLDFFANFGTVSVLTGTTGVSKSSTLRLFIHGLNPSKFFPVYVHTTQVRAQSLLKIVLDALGQDPPKWGKDRLFIQIINHAKRSDQTTLLVFDEAHLIPQEGLTDLRLLVSSGLDETPKIKILLAGQDSLNQRLASPDLIDLAQRVCVRAHLKPFSIDQTRAYIDFRLKVVGAKPDLFDDDAKSLIHDCSGGFPRQINNYAIASLLLAASKGLQRVSETLVKDAIPETKRP